MSKLVIQRESSAPRQRFTFTISGQFPRERELLAHLLKMKNGRTGSAALQLIMLGLETAGQQTQVEMDDNFPWLTGIDEAQLQRKGTIESMADFTFRCQLSLYPDIPEHNKVLTMMSKLTNERRADVLRRLSLRGLRIHALGKQLATRPLMDLLPFKPYVEQDQANDFVDKFLNQPTLPSTERVSIEKAAVDVIKPQANEDENQIELKTVNSVSNSITQETAKKQAKTLQPGDNEARIRIPAFRKNPEFLPLEPAPCASRVLEEISGVVVIKSTPMKAKQGGSSATSGLAAMMGGFTGINADGRVTKSG